jgi:hypothetical protein
VFYADSNVPVLRSTSVQAFDRGLRRIHGRDFMFVLKEHPDRFVGVALWVLGGTEDGDFHGLPL